MSVQAPAVPSLPVPPSVLEEAEMPVITGDAMSVEEYLAFENASETRHEYRGGTLISMAGESYTHNQIAGNFYLRLGMAFLDRDCTVYMEGVRLRVSPTAYRYPDVVAFCGERMSDDGNPPALLNPNLVVEVLSPTTQSLDRGEKMYEYWQIASLTDYVLVAQEKVSVVHCVRLNARQWNMTEYVELTDSLTFASLDVTLTLADIYRKVVFAPAEALQS